MTTNRCTFLAINMKTLMLDTIFHFSFNNFKSTLTYFLLKFQPPSFTYFYMETIFVPYDVLNSLQNERMYFLSSFAKTCMAFGILLNKIILIETSYSNILFYKCFAKRSFKKL
jgi:hypothetical protein